MNKKYLVRLMQASLHTALTFIAVAQTPASASTSADVLKHASPHVTSAAYFLTTQYQVTDSENPALYYGSINNLERYIKELNDKSPNGPHFNRLILSFVDPSLSHYQSGDLTCTGLFEFTKDHNANICSSHNISTKGTDAGKDAFNKLHNIIRDIQRMNIDVYLAVGGWNYSCNAEYYDISSSSQCSPNDDENYLSSFPNPNSPDRFDNPLNQQQAISAYKNVVQLARDLDADGIDIDYEEFWHADMNSFVWNIDPDTVGQYLDIPGDSPSYGIDKDELLSKGKGIPVFTDGAVFDEEAIGKTRVMPQTVDKFLAITKTLLDEAERENPHLKISTAAPAVGAIPNRAANYGTDASFIEYYGGAWYGGNLYGLVYNAANKDLVTINRLESISVMSYDLSENDCGGDFHLPCDLTSQEEFYFGQYMTWLKSGQGFEKSTLVTKGSIREGEGWVAGKVMPKKLLIKPEIHIGFEVGKPAYGNLPLEKDAMTKIYDYSLSFGGKGMIMWDLFKDKRVDEPGHEWQESYASPEFILNYVCDTSALNLIVGYSCQE